MVIEYVIDEVARYLGIDPLEVRKRNFYSIGERDVTPYNMRVEDNMIEAMVTELEHRADYQSRRQGDRVI